jgi:lipopolysaccharide/colanic/teichoic acid biosynthesis glycosyltransferase
LKRAFDLVAAVLGLAVLAPLLVVVAALVAVSSRGPVLFRQQRVGRHGEPFEILKFRTMVDAPTGIGPLVTVAGDRRITRVGRVLRATKLDEVPQLWNVVRGDMSLVGPRPEVPKYVAMYPHDARTKILSIRPGMTDDASIMFRNESEILGLASDPERVYVEQILPRKIEMYLRYADRHSVVGDICIISRTLLRIFQRDR